MATTIQQIDTWRAAHSEHQRLEFKEAKTQFDNRKLYKTFEDMDRNDRIRAYDLVDA